MPLTIIIDLEPNLFRIGPFLITWHGVFAVLGILAAARLGLWLLQKDGVDVTSGADAVGWMVVLGLIGARVLYVWENFKLFAGQLGRIFLLTEGGISQWGGLFGAMAGAYIWARRAKVSYWKVIDAGGAATMIGLAIGRIGDVINGEHHGTPTNLPWGVEYVNADTLGQPGKVVHPEVAYEMILTLVLLAALLPFHQRLKARLPNGVLGLTYLGMYGIGRFFLSFLRTDPSVFLGLRQAQLASAAMVAVAIIAIPILVQRARASRPEAVAVEVAHAAEVAEPVAARVEQTPPARRRRTRAQRRLSRTGEGGAVQGTAEVEASADAGAEQSPPEVEPPVEGAVEPVTAEVVEPAKPGRRRQSRLPRRSRRSSETGDQQVTAETGPSGEAGAAPDQEPPGRA